MIEDALSADKDGHHGWFWQLKDVPDAPESRYLYVLLAGHDFQDGLKNYRDLGFMGKTLDKWGDNMEAFKDMIDTREHAYAERLPRVDALLTSGAADNMQHERDSIETRLNTIERENDVAALGAPDERTQWATIRALEAALAGAPNDDASNALRERLRLVKGVLSFRLNDAFKARVWQERRTIKDLDLALREAQNRWVRVERARSSVTVNTGEFAERLAALEARIAALQTRLAGMEQKQNEYLQQLAVAELAAQKDRLATYEVQARFALASMYDRAANAPKPAPANPPPPRAEEQPAAPSDAPAKSEPPPSPNPPDPKP
jgi:hypothetical protein